MTSLPIDSLLPDIVSSLRARPNLVLEAPPGAGKTTRVPPALLEAGFGEVLVLEPRRLAARLAARRVASERGEELGETVGYQVRFEQFAGPRTRLRFLTEGVLTRRLLADPELRGVGAVVLDEFHERHLEGDLALALLRRLQGARRPDLRLVVMSATLAGEPIARFLDSCPVLRSEGRLFDLEIGYTPHSAESLDELVTGAVERLLREQAEGDVLVFLPGAAEIRRAQRALEGLARRAGLLVLPLYGDLPPDEQDRAIAPARQRKVILSTNVAESSVTIEGVRAVVDSGLARVAKDNPWTGLPRIEIQRIARSSAVQRAGRAGRTGPGRVIRLYSQDDFLRRPEHDQPEVLRRELGQLCLDLHAAGLRDPHALAWLDGPPEPALAAAEDLLHRLEALDAEGRITAFGRQLSKLPLHPRLAALCLHGGAAGCAEAARLAAGNRPQSQQIEQQLRRLAPAKARLALPQALLQAFPDRVARRRKDKELLLSGGSSAVLVNDAGVEKARFLVALDIEERPDQGLPLVREASAIEPEWLLDQFSERVRDQTTVEWNRQGERVEAVSALYYDELLLEESRGAMPPAEEAAALLAHKAVEAGIHRFADAEAVAALEQRVAFAAGHGKLPALDVEAVLRGLCYGLRGFAELIQLTRGGGLERALLDSLGAEGQRALERLAPERIALPSGRKAKVHYAADQTPWVASRLQDFFGMGETPRIAGGAVSLVVHLLAPSQRPVQTTQDLAGFWQRLYPQVRKELSRRYPRHAWPENPYTAYKD
jgi:ATP-dependent helicase HrpB